MDVQNASLRLGDIRVSSLEQASPSYWNRSLYCFRTGQYDRKDIIIKVLQEALAATFLELPVLTAQVVPVEDDEQKGKHDLVPGGNEKLFVKDLTQSSLDYDDLSARGFPLSVFEDRIYWATPRLPSPGDKVPVFAAQANFIKGGLLLGISFWHLVMDGPALVVVLRILAENCLRLQDQDGHSEKRHVEVPDSLFDKTRLYESHGEYQGLLSDHTEYITVQEIPKEPPAFTVLPLKVEVFRISPASVKALKYAATPVIGTQDAGREAGWISTNDAVTALIWRSVMAATFRGTDYADQPMSCCQLAVNARTRLSPPLPADYFGCALTFATNDLLISEILSPGSLPTVALMIRQSINKVNGPYIESLVALMRKVLDYRCFMFRSARDILGRDTVMTSWAGFPLYDYEWGPLLGGKCDRVRAPKLGMYNGLQTVLPKLPERLGGGIEVMIGLEANVMGKLKQDDIWRTYCEPLES